MRTIPLEDGPVRLVGSLDLDRSDRGITPRRLPHWTRPQVPPFMELMVTQPSGVRLEFTTTSSAIELEAMLTGLELPTRPPADAVFDLVVDDEADPRSQAAEPSSRLVVNLARRDDAELIPGEASTIRFEGLPRGIEALRPLAARQRDRRAAHAAHRRRRGHRTRSTARASALDAPRQLDQPLRGLLQSDAHLARGRRAARRCRAA